MNDDVQYSDLLDADDLFAGAEWYDEYDEDVEIIEADFDEDFDEEFDEDLDEGLDELMAEMFGSLTPAESFNIGSALGSIGAGAVQVLGDPTVRQIAATAAPIALGAAGTALGGPVGTVAGAAAGQAVGKALAPKPAAAPTAPIAATPPATAPIVSPKPVPSVTAPAPPPKPVPVPPTVPPPAKPAAQGSAAATQALVLSQRPDVLQCLLALALGQRGPCEINGVHVGAVMNMLASIYGKAAEDADELLDASESTPAYLVDADGYLSADPAAPRERADALYAALIGAENEYLAEAGLA